MSQRRMATLVIGAVALHSVGLGMAMLFAPAWTLRLARWDHAGSTFFPEQAGLFLILSGGAYAVGIWHRPLAWFLVASKASAVLFLIVEFARGIAPPVALLAAVLDGLMGAAVAACLIRQKR